MTFRERPEYQDWRNAVVGLFGRECVLCGHNGNIHIHHVRPVNTHPELVFEPKNGVPLCGNCHAKVKGNELAYIEEFSQRQDAIVKGQSISSGQNINRTLQLLGLIQNFAKQNRWDDALRAVDDATQLAERDGTLDRVALGFATCKFGAYGFIPSGRSRWLY